jgi:hypothetical protein
LDQVEIFHCAGQPVESPSAYRKVFPKFTEFRLALVTPNQLKVRRVVAVPSLAALQFGLGLRQGAQPAALMAEIFVKNRSGVEQKIFSRHFNPVSQRFTSGFSVADRLFTRLFKPELYLQEEPWEDEELDLSPFAMQEVELIFAARAKEEISRSADSAVLWSEPQIVMTSY